MIFNQLYSYFESNKLFYHRQYGFRKLHSTELAVLEFVEKVLKDIDDGNVPYGFFLDLSKAFDTLDHTILLQKLEFYGLSNFVKEIFKNYLMHRKQYVKFEDTKSGLLPITTGVPEGSILSPQLFLIYINDLHVALALFNFILFADDTTLLFFIKSIGNINCDMINA